MLGLSSPGTNLKFQSPNHQFHPLQPSQQSPGFMGEAFGVFFGTELSLCNRLFSGTHFLAQAVTTDRQMQNLDRFCNNSRLILRKNQNNSFDWRPAPRGRDSNRSCLFYSRLVSRWQFQVWDNKACFVVNCIVFHVVYSKEASAHNRRLQSPLCLFSAPTVAAFNSCSPFLCWRPDCCQAARRMMDAFAVSEFCQSLMTSLTHPCAKQPIRRRRNILLFPL